MVSDNIPNPFTRFAAIAKSDKKTWNASFFILPIVPPITITVELKKT